MDKTIGIDFGATNASVAILERNRAQVLANSEGFEATPALVAEMPDGRRLVGQVVQRQLVIHADTTIGNMQSWLGRRFEHPQTAIDSAEVAYGVCASSRGDAWLELCGHAVPPAELGATLLAYLKDLAQEYIGTSVDTAVVAVPASFHAAARRALLDAGNLAEFSNIHLISSAAAAALTYVRQLPEGSEPHTLAIFDWGGGACQVAIVNVAHTSCEVVTTCTDHGCGGNKVDWALAEHLAQEFATAERIALREDAIGWQRVLQAAPEVKRVLAEDATYDVNLPFIAADKDGPKHLAITVTREVFEQLAAPWVKRCRALCDRALEEAGIDAKGVNATLLVGGMTHIPMVKSMVRKAFGKKPLPCEPGLHPQQVVAMGAVLWGAMLNNEAAKVGLLDGLGAEIRVIAGAQRVSLWPRGAALPATAQICIEVPEGAQEQSWDVVQDDDDQPIARISLPGLGAGEVEIKASLDAEGVFCVEARDSRCRPALAAKVAIFGPLTPGEIDQIFARAEARRQEDPVSDSLDHLRRSAEGLVANIENALETQAAEFSNVDVADITGALQNLKQALDSADRAAIEDTYAVLHASTQAIGNTEHASTS